MRPCRASVRRVLQQPQIGDVRILNTQKQVVVDQTVVDFRLVITVNSGLYELMIRRAADRIEPASLKLMLDADRCCHRNSDGVVLVKPQYLDFRDRRVSYEMLQDQIDDPAQLQQAIDQERADINELKLQLHGEAGNMPVNEMESYLVGRLQRAGLGCGHRARRRAPWQCKANHGV